MAERGWQVTGADISATALTTAQGRAAGAGIAGRIDWIEADLARWQPKRQWDLVITNYAHPGGRAVQLRDVIVRAHRSA